MLLQRQGCRDFFGRKIIRFFVRDSLDQCSSLAINLAVLIGSESQEVYLSEKYLEFVILRQKGLDYDVKCPPLNY